MTLKKAHIVEYITLINLQFPNAYQFATERDRELFINLWFEGLKDYPKEICDMAVKRAILKAEFTPKIAMVIKEVESLVEAQRSSDGKLWNELLSALNAIRSELPYASERYDEVIHDDTGLTTAGEVRKRISKVYDGLDVKLKEYCGDVRGFMELAKIGEEDLQYEKGRFLKQLPILTERLKTQHQTPPQLVNLIKGICEENDRKLLGAHSDVN